MILLRYFILLLLPLAAAAAEQSISFSSKSGDEISISSHPAQGELVFLWLPSEAGPQASETITAAQLATLGIEVWRLDLVSDYFLPLAASSLEQIPASIINELIQQAISTTGKQVMLVGTGRAAIPLLRGARLWQQQHPGKTGLAGAILLSPKFFVETPDPGQPAALMPVVAATNLPLFILQPEQSPWYWKLTETTAALEQGGSDVFVRRLPGVRDRFNFRPDASATETKLRPSLSLLLLQASKLLTPYGQTPRIAVAQSAAEPEVKTEKKDRYLQAYKGEPQAPELRLLDLNNKILDLKDLRGKVVLVNFWASWCPPCVHEMPSMQRLQNLLAKQNFVTLGVNMAEDRQTVLAFLNSEVKINFPILLDSNGVALKRWGVFAFPTSYVVDKHGMIRYALFGGVDWDTPDIITRLNALLDER